jgi:outer membrane protein TolC
MSFESDVRRNCVTLSAALLLLAGAAVRAFAGEPVSLELALREARAANAHLPLPALDISIASEREKEARAEQWLKVALEGDFVYAPPGYAEPLTNLGNARLQAVVRQPIYAGGSLKAAVERAGAGVEAARGSRSIPRSRSGVRGSKSSKATARPCAAARLPVRASRRTS